MTIRAPFRAALASAITAACFWAVSLPSAQAVEAHPQGRAVFGSAPMPCLANASMLMNIQLYRLIPEAVLRGMRGALGKDASWKRGDPSYEKARAIVVEVIAAEERSGGPLTKFSVDQIFGDVAALWSDDERRHYTAFFARPAGQRYLAETVDGTLCKTMVDGLLRPPYAPMDAARTAHWQAFLARDASTGKTYPILDKEEQAALDAEFPKIHVAMQQVLKKLASKSAPPMFARVQRALAPRAVEIVAAAGGTP